MANDEFCELADALYAALRRYHEAMLAAAPAVPAGYKLVPVEPTPEMLASTSWPGCAGTDYAHMLAAAPAAPQAEPPLWKRLRDAGFTPRDNRIECEECGKQFTPQFLPIHKCAPQAEPKREPLSDEQITKGEYVLATKFSDGDPGDHWGVGFYDRFENGRHYVIDIAGKQIRGNGFRRAGRITADVGRWLLSAAKSLEASPPGTVNLWTMLTERAHGIGGSDAE